LSLYRPALLSNLEYSAYDRLLRATPARAPSGRITIVDIDERSLASIGQWPWRRDVIGKLIAGTRDLGASTVALDIIFAESDRFEDVNVATDRALAEVLKGGRVVLGYALTFDHPARQSGACVQHPLGIALVRRGNEHVADPFFQATGAVCTLPALTEAAGASGFLNAAPDPDGRLRRVPMLLALDGQVYPSLALASVIASTRAHDTSLRVINVNAATLQVDNLSVPLDGKSSLLLRYRGPKQTFPYVSALEVLDGRADPAAFQDKIVFVGTTALGTREVVSTPIDTLFAGVEVQATVADNLLQRDFVHRPEYGVMVETEIVLGLGILAALVVGRLGLTAGAVGVAMCLAGIWGGAVWLMSTSGTFLSPVYPSMGLVSALGAMGIARFTLERRRADQAGHDKVISQRLMVQTLLSLTEVRDAETGRHSRRTREYTQIIAERLAANPAFRDYLTRERIELLASLAPLHDIGKVGVPDRLLQKAGALTPDEISEMRKHPAHGRDVIVHAEQDVGESGDLILAMAKDIVYTHHEKWDGTGYPQRLRGAAIPVVGRIIAIVDVYDAITTHRVYRDPMSHDEAVALIVEGSGTHFDPAVVEAFVSVAGQIGELSASGEWRIISPY
ncbi:MAG: CHASE2 domain-containing protein, partial [Acidobacteriota bacterium]